MMIPKAIAKPRTFGQGSGELSDALLELGLAVGGAEVDGDQRSTTYEEMDVGVIEARKEEVTMEIDDAGIGAGEFADGCVVADGENAGTVERYSLGGGLRGILSPDLGVEEDQGRLLCRRSAAAGAEQNQERV